MHIHDNQLHLRTLTNQGSWEKSREIEIEAETVRGVLPDLEGPPDACEILWHHQGQHCRLIQHTLGLG